MGWCSGRMQIGDYLNAFSIEDLRELVQRRGLSLPPQTLKGRQTLVRTLSAVLGRYDSIYSVTGRLNLAELAVLGAVFRDPRAAGLNRISSESGVSPAEIKPVLNSLRLWGLLFPEGSWEHIAVPQQTEYGVRHLQHVLPQAAKDLKSALQSPDLARAGAAALDRRPGSLARDAAELLARVARSRFKLTQAGRMNRRDLKGMEGALAVEDSSYAPFLYMLLGGMGMLEVSSTGLLSVNDAADAWLAQPEAERAALAAQAWVSLYAFPETSFGDPGEEYYVPPMLPKYRQDACSLLSAQGPAGLTSASLAGALHWSAPLSFSQFGAHSNALPLASRLLRSLYWLGLAEVDRPAQPASARVSRLGAAALGGEEISLVPEDPQFFLQPNAEVFAPPNLAPRTLFHLRRMTAEKKGGPVGVYPITADSLRRALDSGVKMPEILQFLEAYSRTGLPGTVRTQVETAGRQHGRIRLVPTGYVVVTDEPRLMEELRNVKPVAGLLGAPLTERVSLLSAEHAKELAKRLRARGYAPLDLADTGEAPPVPVDPGAPAPPPPAPDAAGRRFQQALTGDEGDDEEDDDFGSPSGAPEWEET